MGTAVGLHGHHVQKHAVAAPGPARVPVRTQSLSSEVAVARVHRWRLKVVKAACAQVSDYTTSGLIYVEVYADFSVIYIISWGAASTVSEESFPKPN